jgi:hypothetical protein
MPFTFYFSLCGFAGLLLLGGCLPSGSSGGELLAPRTTRIGPEGGEATLGEVRLTVPPGALEAETEVTIETIVRDDVGQTFRSRVYAFEPNGLVFAVPATLTFSLAEGPEDGTKVEILRGEGLDSPLTPISAAVVADAEVSAQISGFSHYVVSQPSYLNFGPQFEVDGKPYSAEPVFRGVVSGFGYSFTAGAGVSDGDGQAGHVWQDDDACYSFRPNGTGVVDLMGGRAADHREFPRISLQAYPGTPEVGLATSRFDVVIGRDVIDPTYTRHSSLVGFRWGVRLNDDGTVHQDPGSGMLEVRIRGDEGYFGVRTIEWDPTTNAPKSSNLDPLTTELSTKHGFCRFFEKRTQDASLDDTRCFTTEESDGQGTMFEKSACYLAGELNGPYEVTRKSDDVVVEGGGFERNRPVGGWTLNNTRPDLQQLGEFNADGLANGLWRMQGGELEVSFAGTLKIALGLPSYVVSGPSVEYDRDQAGALIKRRKGDYKDGKLSGDWLAFADDGCVATLEGYDFDTQIPDGRVCLQAGECMEVTRSWMRRRVFFNFGRCIRNSTFAEQLVYGQNGETRSSTCFEIEGQCTEPQLGAERDCPGACQQ